MAKVWEEFKKKKGGRNFISFHPSKPWTGYSAHDLLNYLSFVHLAEIIHCTYVHSSPTKVGYNGYFSHLWNKYEGIPSEWFMVDDAETSTDIELFSSS